MESIEQAFSSLTFKSAWKNEMLMSPVSMVILRQKYAEEKQQKQKKFVM